MKNRCRLAVLMLLMSTAAFAQQTQSDPYMDESPFERYVSFNLSVRYALSMPMGGQKTYINKLSPTNLLVDAEWLFPQRFSVGLKSGYQYHQQQLPRQLAVFDSQDIEQTVSAVQTRTLTIIPLMASLSYYFADNAAALRPYVQVAGGGASVNYTNFFGTLTDQSKGFKWGFAPAVGIKYYGQRENRLGAEVQLQYQHLNFQYGSLPNSSPSVLVSAGICYRWY